MLYLLIEFLDEFIFGATDAAYPFIRNDLALSYIQIGILLSVPGLIGNLIEPFLFILGDVWRRRVLILTGGVLFTISVFLTAASHNFWLLLFAFVLFNPSSGMFVSLSQATLMDSAPERHEQNMARWTFAGSLGVVVGPLLLGGIAALGFGWRSTFVILGILSTLTLLYAWKHLPPDKNHFAPLPTAKEFFASIRETLSLLKNRSVLRWLVLLEFSDLMLDVLYGFLALYFVDVAGYRPETAVFAVAVWTGVGLLGDFLLIPLVEKVKGLDYLRISVILELILYPAFLLVQQPLLKLVLVGFLGLFNSGWYAILKGNLYSSMPPGKSGAALALNNVSGFFGKLLPLGIGMAAQAFGLQWAMWLILAGPIALLFGLPKKINYDVKEE